MGTEYDVIKECDHVELYTPMELCTPIYGFKIGDKVKPISHIQSGEIINIKGSSVTVRDEHNKPYGLETFNECDLIPARDRTMNTTYQYKVLERPKRKKDIEVALNEFGAQGYRLSHFVITGGYVKLILERIVIQEE